MKRLFLSLILASTAHAETPNPCYWYGQTTKCFPTVGLFLPEQRALRLGDSGTTNYVELKAPSSVTTYSLSLPSAQGASGTALVNDGSGNLSWGNTTVPTSDRYIDFLNGNDTTGDGSPTSPWKTLQHAYNSVSPTINNPYTFHLSGGNNDTDTGTITAKPNVNLTSDSLIQVSRPLSITGSTTNDGVTFSNIIFIGHVDWIRNDASAFGMTVIGSQFFSGPEIKQQGSGTASLNAYNNSVLVNADLLVPNTGSFFFGCTLLGTLTFGDASSAAYYEIIGSYISAATSISGGAQAYFSGDTADVPFGYTLTTATTAKGTPVIQSDSGSIPPTISGPNSLILMSYAQHESYTPTTAGNWNSAPTTVLGGLDTLATSGVVKSQSQNLVLASPNGSSGVPSFRSIVSGDLPTVPIANGGTGQTTKAAAFDALSPLTTKGDLIAYSTTGVRQPVGADGTVLSADSGQATGLNWITVLTNPMTTAGDIIYGGVAGAATRLAAGTSTQLLHGGTTPSWSQVSLIADVTGTLPVGNGGTGATTLASNGVLYGNSTSAVQALAVNSTATNKFLTQSSSNAPAWNTIAAADLPTATNSAKGAVTSYYPTVASSVHAVSADYTILDGDGYAQITEDATGGNKTVTLPSAANNAGRIITVSKVDSTNNSVSLARAGSDTIAGATSQVVFMQYGTIVVQSDGSATWDVLSIIDSGSFTINYTGPTANSVTYFFSRVGKSVNIRYANSLAACSNATSYSSNSSFFPTSLRPTITLDIPIPVEDNGSVQSTLGFIEIGSDGSSGIGKTLAAGAFTASGNCGPIRSSFSYTIN